MNYRRLDQGAPWLLGVLVLLLSSVPVRSLAAQQPTAQTPGWSAAEILAQYEAEQTKHIDGKGTFQILYVMDHDTLFLEAKRDSLLDGLERLALTSNHEGTRIGAVSLLSTIGRRTSASSGTDALPRRMQRIYTRSTDEPTRNAVLRLVFVLADRDAVLEFLRGVAQQPPEPTANPARRLFHSDPDEPSLAISALARMGGRGRAALRELHQSDAVRSPQAQAQLQRLAEHGFPVIDERAARERLEREHDRTPHH